MLLKQGDRARTVGTAANAGTTRCYICSWCDISLPELPICSFPANKMDVIVASNTNAGEFQEFVLPIPTYFDGVQTKMSEGQRTLGDFSEASRGQVSDPN